MLLELKRNLVNLKQNNLAIYKTSFLFFLFLVLPIGATTPDNAEWLHKIIKDSVSIPDSILAQKRIYLEKNTNLASASIIYSAITQNLITKNYNITNSKDSADLILNLEIIALRVDMSPLYNIFFIPTKITRLAVWDMKISAYEKPNNNLKWYGVFFNSQSNTLPYSQAKYLNSSIYPEITTFFSPPIIPVLTDFIILLGSAACIIYFVYN